MHVTVDRCDIEMVKILLIYGADASLVRVKTRTRGKFLQGGYRGSDMDEKQRNRAMRAFCHGFKDKVGQKLEKHEEVLDVYQILDKTECADANKKKQIRALLASENIWFPELVEYYPVDQGRALEIMYQVLGKVMPTPMIGIVAQYYYTRTVHDEPSDNEKAKDEEEENSDY